MNFIDDKIDINGNYIFFLSSCPKVFSLLSVKVLPLRGLWSETRRGGLATENMSHTLSAGPCSSLSPTTCFPDLYRQCPPSQSLLINMKLQASLTMNSSQFHFLCEVQGVGVAEGVLAGAGWAAPDCEWNVGSWPQPLCWESGLR